MQVGQAGAGERSGDPAARQGRGARRQVGRQGSAQGQPVEAGVVAELDRLELGFDEVRRQPGRRRLPTAQNGMSSSAGAGADGAGAIPPPTGAGPKSPVSVGTSDCGEKPPLCCC